ncbi:MAG: heavy-metal-associated domain-containing protein [Defluviitaleaceae bacterium]|nr:heavy-metal-associated domain-containing protein [Defluviitaleaceae bacterium]
MKKILFLVICSMFFALVACDNNEAVPGSSEQVGSVESDDASRITTTLTVSGMNCQRCVTVINAELSALSGVISVEINLRSGVLVVEHEPGVSVEEIRDILALEGFEVF